MKKIITILLLITTLMITNSIVASYTPTVEDEKIITMLDQQIERLSETPKDLRNFYYQFKTLKRNFSHDEQLFYLLEQLAHHSYEKFTQEKYNAKKKSKAKKKAFVQKYISGVKEKKVTIDKCKEHYTLVDDVSFAYNFPTALTIATRYREHSCKWSLPANGDGPFQIVNKDY